ncbi:MAG: ribonuclease HII [Armatimonadota bacterium]
MAGSRRKAAPTDHERRLWTEGVRLIAGIDEAGRGAWAGPVVAGAVILPRRPQIPGVTDSKLLTAAQREALFDEIAGRALAWAVAAVGPDTISDINILASTYRAMIQAVAQLDPSPDYLLIDGRDAPSFPQPHLAITGGDARCYSIAAASILAKVWRDRFMRELDKQYPGYGFARHKGYGTREHRRALAELGPCPQHRRRFAPIMALAQGELDLAPGTE